MSGPPTEGGSVQLHVSTVFFPAAALPGSNQKPDIIVFTSDSVAFYCHKTVFAAKSANYFGGLLLPSPAVYFSLLPSLETGLLPKPNVVQESASPGLLTTIFVTENSVVFNTVLHMIYPGLSCARYGPDIQTISEALYALSKYGVPSPDNTSDIWHILAAHAPAHPLRVYTVGAANASELICSQASPRTLGASLGFLTEADALTMGCTYLRRLSFLHAGRVNALKRIIAAPPDGHDGCSPPFRHSLTLAWKEGVAQVLLQPHPQNTAASTLITTFGPLARTSSQCPRCKQSVLVRVNTMCREWESVSQTI